MAWTTTIKVMGLSAERRRWRYHTGRPFGARWPRLTHPPRVAKGLRETLISRHVENMPAKARARWCTSGFDGLPSAPRTARGVGVRAQGWRGYN